MSTSIPRDVQEFLEGYPDVGDNQNLSANLEFYQNLRKCRPNNLLIDELHAAWYEDYSTLEWEHGYIQWLFPIREHGVNYAAQPLERHEMESMRADPKIIERVLTSYKLMLDFYGMRLVDQDTGLLDRSLPPKNYKPRYSNLVNSGHNNLRISRILKHLSEMGLEHLNAGFLLHILNEQSENKELKSRFLLSSMDRWWANCLRNEEERGFIGELIGKVRNGSVEFTREQYELALRNRKEGGKLSLATPNPIVNP